MFSKIPSVNEYAEFAYKNVPHIYPVFFLSKPNSDNEPSEQTIKCISMFDQLAAGWQVDVCILTSQEGHDAYKMRFPHCSIYMHDFNRQQNLRHVTSMIRNRILDIANSAYRDSEWIYMFDDDIVFTKQASDDDLDHEIDDVEDLATVLKIWQMKVEEAKYNDLRKTFAMSAMPVVNKHTTTENLIDDVRACQAVMLNVAELTASGIRYDDTQRIWEDFDLLIHAAYENLSCVGVTWPIHFKEIRKMFSSESSVNYDVTKLNELSINLYKKWGKHIIPYFRPNSGMSTALNVKVGNCGEWMKNGCPVEVDENVMRDLECLQLGHITLDEFSKRNCVKNDYR